MQINGPVRYDDGTADFIVNEEKKRGCCNRRCLLIVGITSFVAVILSIVLPVYFVVVKRRSEPAVNASKRGGNGTQIRTADGSQFLYLNPFGGYCR